MAIAFQYGVFKKSLYGIVARVFIESVTSNGSLLRIYRLINSVFASLVALFVVRNNSGDEQSFIRLCRFPSLARLIVI